MKRLHLAVGVSLLLALAGGGAFGQSLPGFTLTGENWTYDPGDGGALITGILSRPSTHGPLPAVLISHGKGGERNRLLAPTRPRHDQLGVGLPSLLA